MNRRIGFGFLLTAVALVGSMAFRPALFAGQGLAFLDAIATAHNAELPPTSVRLTGTVERDKKTERFTLLATSDEKIRIEFGTERKDTVVISQGLSFQDDGQKFTYPKAPSGFSQLDITGLFLVQQLRNRAVRVERMPNDAAVSGIRAHHIRVESERTQLHRGKTTVNDRVDLYVAAENGLLLATSRSFYEGRPERYTLTFTFSDYRKTDRLLLPYRIEAHIKGRKTQTYMIETYQFDVQADRQLFMSRRPR